MLARTFAATAAALLAAAASPAHANIIYTLEDITFSDGATASGSFTLDVYDYVTGPLEVITTATVTLDGYTYTLADPVSINTPTQPDGTAPAYTVVTLSRADYDGYLQLDFAIPLSNLPDADPLVLGGDGPVGGSYECGGYENYSGTLGYCTSADVRYVTGGFAVPEPSSLALLGSALLSAGCARRRRRRA